MSIYGPKSGNGRASAWTEVENVPYDGPKPSLPRMRTLQDKDGQHQVKIHPLTRAWWKDISRQPHCILWDDAQWRFAITTAIIADTFFQTSQTASATELRAREKVLGATAEARERLKIRYVDAKPKLTVVPDPEPEDLEELYGAD